MSLLVIRGVRLKGIFAKIFLSVCGTVLFDLYGFIFAIGILLGREISQAEYRFLAKGHKWSDITWRVYFDLNNYKAERGGVVDTILDVFIPFLVGVLVLCFMKYLNYKGLFLWLI